MGYIDIVGRQNIIDFSLGLDLKPAKKMGCKLAHHFFRRAEATDAFYNTGGGVVRAGTAGTDKEIGSEMDIKATYSINSHTSMLFGYSHFFTGDFIEQTGASKDTDFFYTQVLFRF